MSDRRAAQPGVNKTEGSNEAMVLVPKRDGKKIGVVLPSAR